VLMLKANPIATYQDHGHRDSGSKTRGRLPWKNFSRVNDIRGSTGSVSVRFPFTHSQLATFRQFRISSVSFSIVNHRCLVRLPPVAPFSRIPTLLPKVDRPGQAVISNSVMSSTSPYRQRLQPQSCRHSTSRSHLRH
jgi:hypothetical protein